MAVVNVTPDSFYDGGRYADNSAVAARISQLVAEGADILDLGAESSRPGSVPVPADEQLRRLDYALGCAAETRLLVSVDTTSPEVVRACGRRGLDIVNDVSCLANIELALASVEVGAALVITHSRSPMTTMQGFSTWPDDDYHDVVADVSADWQRARERALQAGMRARDVVFDPGFGFSKNARHSFELLARLSEFRALDALILSGPSRKSFLAYSDHSPPDARLGGTIAASVLSAQHGADIIRVHDVHPVTQALDVLYATQRPELARPSAR